MACFWLQTKLLWWQSCYVVLVAIAAMVTEFCFTESANSDAFVADKFQINELYMHFSF
jgi:hypothetical protein